MSMTVKLLRAMARVAIDSAVHHITHCEHEHGNRWLALAFLWEARADALERPTENVLRDGIT